MTVNCELCGSEIEREEAVFVGSMAHCPRCQPDSDEGAPERDENGETTTPDGGSGDENPIPDADESWSADAADGINQQDTGEDPDLLVNDDGLPGYAEVLRAAQDLADRERWEPVEEEALREVLSTHGIEELLDDDVLARTGRWRVVDMSEDDEEPRRRWYYATGEEPRPDEFRRFHQLLTAAAPDKYEPHYFRVARAGKDPATQFGSWKRDDARLTVEEAIEWMEQGGNVGIAGRGECKACDGDGVDEDDEDCPECDGEGQLYGPLVNVDIDDDEATAPEDVPTSLRARSRSRTGWHTWYFDEDGEIPNIPTDEYGEVRADWQYVVAPGSFVASAAEEIPQGADDPGYYTVEDTEPVASIEYDDLPEVFIEAAEAVEERGDEDTGGSLSDFDVDIDEEVLPDQSRSAVFDIEAAELVPTSDPSDRFPSKFHGSSTDANMGVSRGMLHCWRHNVAHGGLQALATLSDQVRHGCQALGKGHKKSNAGKNRLKGDWRLVWAAWHYAKDGGMIPDDDPIPYRALLGVAVEDGLVDREDLVYRDTDTGEVVEDGGGGTYRALPPGTYDEALEHVLEEYGVDPGREPASTPDEDGEETLRELSAEDILDNETTLERHEAHRASRTVTPDDLDKPLAIDADGDGWVCPDCGDHVERGVRAAALADGAVDCCGDQWENPAEYDRQYCRLREEHGAPLPEYIPPTRAVEDMDLASGAVGALRGWHILDAMDSEVTVENPNDPDAVAVLDPTWEDSDSGERIVLFNSGLFYCREHEQVLWPLQVAALDAGIVDSEEETLRGDLWLRAYAVARTEYDAPLPPIVWNDADEAPEPLHLPVLPDPDDLLGEGVTTDAAELQNARDAVESLYRDLATGPSKNHLLRALPALGKTYSAIVQAKDTPTMYAAERLELRDEAATEADEHGITWMHAPTLGESRPPERVVSAAAGYVRENGRGALRDREDLLAAVEDTYKAIDEEWPAYEEKYGDDDSHEHDHDADVDVSAFGTGDECPGCTQSFDTVTETRTHIADCQAGVLADTDEVDLDREACECGNGEHGPEWHLAIWTARKLGDKPRDLHTRGETIFGDSIPCTDDDGKCPYTEAWERATDPDAPVDLLIGHPVHAYVGGAKVQPRRTENDRVSVEDRVVVFDEFPGDVYTSDFEEEAIQHARWLGSCLDPRIEDTTDLLDHRDDLWSDEFVTNWVNGEASPPILDALQVKREQADDEDADPPDWEAFLDAEYRVCGDLAALVDRAVEAAADPDRDAEELLDSAMTALEGGREGVEALTSGAEDGYAHPDAYWLFLAVIAPDAFDGADLNAGIEQDWRASVTSKVRDAEYYDLGSDNGRIKAVTVADRFRVLLDRDHAGAELLTPPDLGANTVVALDATGRPALWELALGADFETADIHDGPEERRGFLRDVLNLRVVQTTPHIQTYGGSPANKNFGGDIELVDTVAEEYSRHQLAQDRLSTTTAPAVVTTKTVEDYIGGGLRQAGADVIEHYGDLVGSNRLGEYTVGVILGAEHYGHEAAEKWALFAGEEFDKTGHGSDLDYESHTANALLNRMWDDQVMQSIMRFSRDEEGAVVFAHTAAMREDVPIVEQGDVVEAWSENQQAVAKAAADRKGEPFTVSDIVEDDRIDCHRRTVRRLLNEFASLGYVHREAGHTNEYTMLENPGTGTVDVPSDLDPPDTGVSGASESESRQIGLENTNTWFVWSRDRVEAPHTRPPPDSVRLGPPEQTTHPELSHTPAG